jgi:hypothetical protein
MDAKQKTIGMSENPAALYMETLDRSRQLSGGMGAIAFGVLEMFRLGGMDEDSIRSFHEKMQHYFMIPTNEECNAICKMVETRLAEDRRKDNNLWYKSKKPA